MLIDKDGVVQGATFHLSPNHDERPIPPEEISLLVIHGISLPPGKFGSMAVKDFFLNQLDIAADPAFENIRDLKVSSHLYITREGALVQFVPFNKRAWHAGLSAFEGQEKCNDFSIGIELEGTDDVPYTPKQYESLLAVSVLILKTYPKITLQRIVGHADIAPGRKTDPGPHFDWKNYVDRLSQLI